MVATKFGFGRGPERFVEYVPGGGWGGVWGGIGPKALSHEAILPPLKLSKHRKFLQKMAFAAVFHQGIGPVLVG